MSLAVVEVQYDQPLKLSPVQPYESFVRLPARLYLGLEIHLPGTIEF